MRAGQQTARVNIGDEHWRDFRILAIESDRSVAEYLGQLVRDELRRSRRRRRAEEHVDAPSEDSTLESRVRKDGPQRTKRLAEVQLLTELPRPGER
jgi:hypothetical protein